MVLKEFSAPPVALKLGMDNLSSQIRVTIQVLTIHARPKIELANQILNRGSGKADQIRVTFSQVTSTFNKAIPEGTDYLERMSLQNTLKQYVMALLKT